MSTGMLALDAEPGNSGLGFRVHHADPDMNLGEVSRRPIILSCQYHGTSILELEYYQSFYWKFLSINFYIVFGLH